MKKRRALLFLAFSPLSQPLASSRSRCLSAAPKHMSSSSSHRTSVLDVADELSSLDIIDVDEEAEPTPAACASERAPVIDVDDLDAAAGTANASEIGTPSQPSMVENSAIDEYDEDLGSNNGDPDGVASTEPFDGLAGAALAESLLPLELSDGSRALLLVLSRGQVCGGRGCCCCCCYSRSHALAEAVL